MEMQENFIWNRATGKGLLVIPAITVVMRLVPQGHEGFLFFPFFVAAHLLELT